MPPPDPGYGDPRAPIGSVEWAKRWRLGFQGAAKRLPEAPGDSLRYFEVGKQYRAWTLLTDEHGKKFPKFDTFCACRQPWGLGVDPAKFRAHIEAEAGKRAVDLLTVASGDDKGGRRKKEEITPPTVGGVSGESISHGKEEALRAILRAPEVVQDLYREGCITQKDAARLGPKAPTPEQAGRIAEARQGLEGLDRSLPKRDFRRQAGEAVARVLGRKGPTPLDLLRRAWARASEEERAVFLAEVASAELHGEEAQPLPGEDDGRPWEEAGDG